MLPNFFIVNNIWFYIYVILIVCFNVYLYLYSYYEYVYNIFEDDVTDTYDFIIVGCGTAGSLIAHHFSGNPDLTFLALEAGGGGGPFLNPPAIGPLLHGTIHDWQYETVQQYNSCLSMSGKCKLPAGKIIGGSSKLNNMIHIREYIDEMATWFDGRYSIYFLKSLLKDVEKTDLVLETLNHKTELASTVVEAAEELGFGDPYYRRMGFMETLVNQKEGARWTTSSLLYNNDIKNGRVITNAFVERIIINPDNNEAKAVIYERFGKKRRVVAKRAIILTAGAIGTPKLLMLSGIGPKNHLEKLNIPLVKDLPVGQNLMDHVSVGLDLILLSKSIGFDLESFLNPLNAWDYFINGNGLWTSGGCEAIAIINTCTSRFFPVDKFCINSTLPDLQLMVMPMGISTDYGAYLRETLGIAEETWKYYFEKLVDVNTVSILPVVLHPKSKGYVELSSNDPYAKPIINPNYFSDEYDLAILIKGIELVKKLINTKAMRKLGAELNTHKVPGCVHTEFDTRDYWECYIKHLTLTVYHPAGTCKIGYSEKTSVVDYFFRVHGIQSLYVADASIFPYMPSGNINMAVAVVARLFAYEMLDYVERDKH